MPRPSVLAGAPQRRSFRLPVPEPEPEPEPEREAEQDEERDVSPPCLKACGCGARLLLHALASAAATGLLLDAAPLPDSLGAAAASFLPIAALGGATGHHDGLAAARAIATPNAAVVAWARYKAAHLPAAAWAVAAGFGRWLQGTPPPAPPSLCAELGLYDSASASRWTRGCSVTPCATADGDAETAAAPPLPPPPLTGWEALTGALSLTVLLAAVASTLWLLYSLPGQARRTHAAGRRCWRSSPGSCRGICSGCRGICRARPRREADEPPADLAQSRLAGLQIVRDDIRRAQESGQTYAAFRSDYRPVGGDASLHKLWEEETSAAQLRGSEPLQRQPQQRQPDAQLEMERVAEAAAGMTRRRGLVMGAKPRSPLTPTPTAASARLALPEARLALPEGVPPASVSSAASEGGSEHWHGTPTAERVAAIAEELAAIAAETAALHAEAGEGKASGRSSPSSSALARDVGLRVGSFEPAAGAVRRRTARTPTAATPGEG